MGKGWENVRADDHDRHVMAGMHIPSGRKRSKNEFGSIQVRGLPRKEGVLAKDKAGNKIVQKYIKSRNVWQLSVQNRQGRNVNFADAKAFISKKINRKLA